MREYRNINKCKTIEELAGRLSQIIMRESGNVLGSDQQSMVISRLQKRMYELNFTLERYAAYVENHYKQELTHLIGLLTTHHTFFFREFSHFEFIIKNLPKIVENAKKRGENKIKIYSAACSRGQEAYSLALLMEKHLKEGFPEMDYEIFGTDIDPECVKHARNGVYPYKEVKSIPIVYLHGRWQRGTGAISAFARIKKDIKNKCRFDSLNLLEMSHRLMGVQFDIIFCRNVFIYFSPDSVKRIVDEFSKHIYEGGYLITGLSESLKSAGLRRDFAAVAPSVYHFGSSASSDGEFLPSKTSLIPDVVRLLAVDDSKSILKLMSRIFKDDKEFELVGTASNGLEARDFLKTTKVDAVLLDIHMPELDGINYLKEDFSDKHPPVVMVSSASREDSGSAQKAFEYGASDFVEKPTVSNMAEKSSEIKMKVRSALSNRGEHENHKFSAAESMLITNVERKARVIFASFSDLGKVKQLLKNLKGAQPPSFIIFEGNENFLHIAKEEFLKNGVASCLLEEGHVSFDRDKTYICDAKRDIEKIKNFCRSKKVSINILGHCSDVIQDTVSGWEGAQILLEDVEGQDRKVIAMANECFSWTSFSQVDAKFLAKD